MIQVPELVDLEPDEPYEVWRDVATVTVPPRTKRRTVVRLGLEQAGIELTPETRARSLDGDSAYTWEAKPPQAPALRLT